MKRICLFMAAAAAVVSFAGCNSQRQVSVNTAGTVNTTTAAQTEVAIEQVIYGSWAVVDVNGTKVEGPDAPYLEFGKDATNPFLVKCYAFDGCNYINSVYAITSGGSMKLSGEPASTMRMCPDAPYEMGVTMALNTVSNYRLEKVGLDYLLYLNNASGETMMTLRKYDESFIDGTWNVVSIEGASVPADAEQSLIFDLKEKTVTGNAGCNVVNGHISVNANVQNSFELTDLVTTRMTCPNIELEQKLINALNQVRVISPTGSNEALLKDAAGQTLVTLRRAN